jgi:hypothetical protein
VSVNIPGAGSWEFRHDVSAWYSPVSLFSPSHAPGTCVSVGWSKLCHSTLEALPPSRRTRLPSSRITAVLAPGEDGRDVDDMLDDQTTDEADDGDDGPTSSRLPSAEDTRSWAEATSERGRARLATQMTVWTGMFLYQMPR